MFELKVSERFQKNVRGALMLFFAIAALFYLLVVPMLAATKPTESGTVGLVFGAFMLLQLFGLVFLYSYWAMSTIYRLPRLNLFYSNKYAKILKTGTFRHKPSEIHPHHRSGIYTVLLVIISYPMFVYAFAVLYVYLSNVSSENFDTINGFSTFDGFYFSTVTATTVGYGDITPKSLIAKSVTIIQIYLSLTYAVLIFSGLSNHLRGLREYPKTK